MSGRPFAAALVAAAALALPARHAGAQGVKQDVKDAASDVGHTTARLATGAAKGVKKGAKATGKGVSTGARATKHAVVTGADATADAGKKAGTYVKHRVTPRHKKAAADSAPQR